MDRKDKNNGAGSRDILLICLFTLTFGRAFAAGVELDGTTNTGIDAAPNGVPVVNIADPNSRGLSHNSFIRFNVNNQGLILNNANQTVVNTELGGQIFGNGRLGNPASVILNEVTSTHPSLLNGYTEVAGPAADVVIANPNGISLNGAGFINAPRVTLTTGSPQISAGGQLNGFDVLGGQVSIEGEGFNSNQQDVTSIYTHFLNLNAKLHARDLDIALGVNQIDYPGRKIVSNASSTSQRVLLDSSALGGMYANKIVLVGTDQGLGMNLPPEVMASSGGIEITSDGRIRLQQLDAGGDIVVRSAEQIETRETVYSASAVHLEAGQVLVGDDMIAASNEISITADSLENNGSILAGVRENGEFNSWGSLDITAGMVTNSGELLSSSLLAIIATDLTNQGRIYSGISQTGAINSSALLEIDTDRLLNQGELNSRYALNLEASLVDNQALIYAGNNLNLKATELINETTLFSGSNMQLYVDQRLDNLPDASILAIDNLTIAGDPQLAKTGVINNDLGLIQTHQGDIDIYAVEFNNHGLADIQYELIYYDLGNSRETTSLSQAQTLNLAYSTGYTKHRATARRRWVNEILSRLAQQAPDLYQDNATGISTNRYANFLAIETRMIDLSTTTPAYLDSGNNLNLHVDRFTNENSVVAAAADINLDISQTYLNIAASASEAVTDYRYYTHGRHSDNWLNDDKYSSNSSSGYIPVATTETVSSNTVTQAGGNINGSVGGQLVNSGSGVRRGQYQIAASIDTSNFDQSAIVLPTHEFGLFVTSSQPDSDYLIETNPAFTQFSSMVGSGYLLDRLNFPGIDTLKRLGDSYYETKLIRDSIFSQSGQRYLDTSISDDQQQFQFLMDNALIAHQALELTPGVALNTDQINRLNQDIVWLESQIVAGQTVLVPRVYLANGTRARLHNGQILAGNETNLVVASLDNRGIIESGGNISLESSDNILNRGEIAAGDQLKLIADQNIENLSGHIRGDDVVLESVQGSVVNRRESNDYRYNEPKLEFSSTVPGDAGIIEADQSLDIRAADEIRVEGSIVAASAVALEADEINIQTSEETNEFFAGSRHNYVKESAIEHFASTVIGDEIVILSAGKTGVRGSELTATQSLQINAASISVEAVHEQESFESMATDDDTFSESVSIRKSLQIRNLASQLNAATVVLVTEQGDIELTGSQIQAGTRLSLDSAGDIRVLAGHDASLDESYEHESSYFSGDSLYSETEDLEGKITRSAINSRIDAGSIDLQAANQITMEGVDIVVDEDLVATAAEITIRNATSEETRYSHHTEINVGFGEVVSNLADIGDLISNEDGKLSLALAEAQYEHVEDVESVTSVEASQIVAANIALQAGDAQDGNLAGDIVIEGSHLFAEDEIELNAVGDVALLDAHSIQQSEVLTQSGTARLNLNLQNEYDQVARAIKGVKAAESDLRQAQQDYDDYKERLDQQQLHLDELRQDLASGTGFIEQADIDELQRKVDRLKDDDDFYQANIVLATATLTTKTTALIKQTGQAAASSGTYGFNLGLELDIEALENRLDSFVRQSQASTLQANDIVIRAGDTALVRGSTLLAENQIDINADDIEISAGASDSNQLDRSQQIDLSYNWDLLGGESPMGLGDIESSFDMEDLGGSIGVSGNRNEAESVWFNNARLQADTIRLSAVNDTHIEGAEIDASTQLQIDTGNLTLASVQNSTYQQSNSQGLNHSGSGGGLNVAQGEQETVSTLQTSLSGSSVDIRVEDHTEIRGAVIAAIDSDGKDNGQLTLSTNTLNASSLNNTVDVTDRSIGVNAGTTASLSYQNDDESEKTKSLATIGNGSIQIEDIDNSNIRLLNSDIEATEVAVYAIESHQGLAGELDTRLLSEQGLDQIAEDWLKTEMIANSIELIATTDRVGIEDFFAETEMSHQTYQAVKAQIANDPELAAMLQNPALSADQKQQMLDQITDAVMIRLGFETHDNAIIATDQTSPDGDQFYGFYSEQTEQAYINDPNHSNTRDLISTAGHEASHAMDQQSGNPVSQLDDLAQLDTNIYANNFGENLADFADFALDINGYDGLAVSNEHVGNDSRLVILNNTEFSNLNINQGDFRLSEEQKADEIHEISECTIVFCEAYVETKYSVISSVQGVAEISGAASGAITQVLNDVENLIAIIDDLIEDPDKLESVAQNLLPIISRISELADGSQLTQSEADAIVVAINDATSEVMVKIEDASLLDSGGLNASFNEGEAYGVYLASIVPLSRISKYLKSIGSIDANLGTPDGLGLDGDVTNSKELTPFVSILMPTRLEHSASSGAELVADPNKTTTILGSYRLDTSKIIDELDYPKTLDFEAKDGSFNLLNTPDSLFSSRDQFWDEFNKPFLDKAIERGDNIILTTRPTRRVLVVEDTGELTSFGREIDYLQRQGYTYDATTNMMMLNR